MFFNKVLSAAEVQLQYSNFISQPPVLAIRLSGNQATLLWPTQSVSFALEAKTNLSFSGWTSVGDAVTTNGAIQSVTVPASEPQKFFRLKNP